MTSNPQSIVRATRRFEGWLKLQTTVVPADLRLKHEKMAEDAFSFLRATFYRWLEQWPLVCPGLLDAPHVTAIGDVHVENFGTWRDEEGRLIWGVNDLDDACELPYVQDLVRLATSARLALRAGRLDVSLRQACGEVLDGYRASLEKGGRPIVLAERHKWLRDIAVAELRDPAGFWAKLQELPATAERGPFEVLRASLPKSSDHVVIARRAAGVGSLGRQRFAAVASLGGSRVGREAKALVPSARAFLTNEAEDPMSRVRLLENAVRVRDPFLTFRDGWVIRRLAPDCLKIELGQFPTRRYERKLLRSMGWETANMHLATASAEVLLRDLDKRRKGWLVGAVEAMTDVVIGDWRDWKKART